MVRLSLPVVFLAGACTSLGAIGDGTSVSYGWSHRGSLVDAVELPFRGDGYLVPTTWASRGLNWGTEELVGLIVRSSRRVRAERPDATLYVADLSPRHGGPSAWHRSHQTGRDADLHFFALDGEGRPAPPPMVMVRFDDQGLARAGGTAGQSQRPQTFDVERNWLLVRALLEDPIAEVQFLFISAGLRLKLLEHAVAIGEPVEVVTTAAAVLVQPGDSLPHDDHLHVRIFCPASDRSLGCRDRGPQRWLKKGWKYAASRPRPAPALAAIPSTQPLCRLIASSLLAWR
jgi:penicillin-insensitive murein DD-endopeptidase